MSGKSQHYDPRVIVALDFNDQGACLNLVDQLEPSYCRLKVGKEMFTLFGPSFVENLQSRGFDIFLDLKFHDIPATVGKAVAAAADLGVWMVNVHASGGRRMLDQAKSALAPYQQQPLLIAVTVLTSMDQNDFSDLGIQGTVAEHVQRLAGLAHESGLDGLVCSAQEANQLKAKFGQNFKLVTPGIRPVGAAQDDQRRIMTPEQAISSGSDYLVIGRPITQSAEPAKVCRDIAASLLKLEQLS